MEKLSPAEEAELDRTLDTLEPIDVPGATRVLLEIKQVMDDLGVTFFLRQGTCLGAVRDGAFIPWDDDIDVGSVIGLHGFNEAMVEPVARALRERGFLTRVERKDHYLYVPLVKPPVRADWCCYWVMDKAVFMYPGIRIPVRLLGDLKKIDFLGSEFCVPTPPEEYLEVKYGPDWRVPKQIGDYEEDVLELMPDAPAPGRAGRLKQLVASTLMPWHTTVVRVLDERDRPVSGAEVSIAGMGTSRANRHGVVKLYVPREDHYAVVVRFSGHEGVLYVERLKPAARYTYRPGREHLLARDARQESEA